MHNSVDGETVRGGSPSTIAVNKLLAGSDPSSVCLNCHSDTATSTSFYHVMSLDGSIQSPGGDFFWTSVTLEYTTHSPQTRHGYSMGHSINAQDFPNIQTEADYTVAPGGSYDPADLGCNSCHDPHGTKYYADANNKLPIAGSGSYGGTAPAGATLGNYRLLGDEQYAAGSGVTFQNAPPVAVSPSYSVRNETNTNHASYGYGTAEWCANCHGGLLVSNPGAGKHPAGTGVYVGNFVDNYNEYVATGDSSGSFATAYDALVPIERGETDVTLPVMSTGSTAGATAAKDTVSCLTCHRAHASAFEYATRWDTSTELLVESHPDGDTTVVGGTIAGNPQQVAYYGRDIASVYNEYQRSLCNKCHVMD
jgi:cytochrome c553